jgi:cation:H+ antiporter
MNEYLALLLGAIFAGFGGELFVRGSVGLAHSLRIPPGIVGATAAAFATSSPELATTIIAKLRGQMKLAWAPCTAAIFSTACSSSALPLRSIPLR